LKVVTETTGPKISSRKMRIRDRARALRVYGENAICVDCLLRQMNDRGEVVDGGEEFEWAGDG